VRPTSAKPPKASIPKEVVATDSKKPPKKGLNMFQSIAVRVTKVGPKNIKRPAGYLFKTQFYFLVMKSEF
jgi:hypothetical protein